MIPIDRLAADLRSRPSIAGQALSHSNGTIKADSADELDKPYISLLEPAGLLRSSCHRNEREEPMLASCPPRRPGTESQVVAPRFFAALHKGAATPALPALPNGRCP